MLTREEAESLVLPKLAELAQQPVSILKVTEKDYGWIFFWNSRHYVETQSVSDYLFGNAPALVSKADGTITLLNTGQPVAEQLESWELAHFGKTFSWGD